MFKKPHRKGADCPPYCFASIIEIFRRYEAELVGKYAADPLGTRVWFMDYNFPKLIQLQFRGNKANASKAIEYFHSGNRCEDGYSFDSSRLSTLFWIPDLIKTPDSIHPNKHRCILGDEVYVKRYSKAGACFKLVFTVIDELLNQRVVTTSFLTPEDRLELFIGQPPKWIYKPKKEDPAKGAQDLLFPK
jgi:hypothetical protein